MSPTLGRFLQRDPIGYVDGMSLYEFAGNTPPRLVDPSGKAWYDWVPFGTWVHAVFTDPPGANVEDYEDLRVTREECRRYGLDVAQERCRNRMRRRHARYQAEYEAGGLAGGAGLAIGGTVITGVGVKIKNPVVIGVGSAVTLGGAANAATAMDEALDIYLAYRKALQRYCVCCPPE